MEGIGGRPDNLYAFNPPNAPASIPSIPAPAAGELALSLNSLSTAGVALTNKSPAVTENLLFCVVFPVLPVGKQILYFLPERILVKDGKQFGTINYRDLELRIENTQFIESEGVPSDSEIVGWTWKYVNKKGGPDKRFKDNVEIPILRYSEIHFSSRSGLNEMIQLSKPNLGQELVTALKVRAET